MLRLRSTIPSILLGAALAAHAATVDELIQKNIEARGGRANLESVKSLKATGKVLIDRRGSVIEMAYTMLQKRPGLLRQERSIQGLSAITAFDGEVGWTVQPFGGRREPQKLTADVVKTLRVDADIDGPLVNYKEKGNSVEYLGTDDVEGTEAHKLQVTLGNGDVRYFYLDPDYFLVIRLLSRETVRGVEEETETDLGNYELVNGLTMPFSIESGPRGRPKNLKITIEKVELNVPIDDCLFLFPAPGPGSGK